MADELKAVYLSTRPVVDEATVRLARRTVCEHAEDATDARDLLAVLGLIDAAVESARTPLPCGHPHSALRRRLNGRRGTECELCARAAARIRAARSRALRVRR